MNKVNINKFHYLKGHLKNIQIYINLILKHLNLYDMHDKTNILIYESFVDSIIINIYWIAEMKNVKNVKATKNLNNPFYIWCKFFDSAKHPKRQIEISNKILNALQNSLKICKTGEPILFNLNDFVYNLKSNDENVHVDNETYYNLYIKFIHPHFIEINKSNLYLNNDPYSLTLKYCIIFWDCMLSFSIFLSQNVEQDWSNIWKNFFENYRSKDAMSEVWNFYKKLFNLY